MPRSPAASAAPATRPVVVMPDGQVVEWPGPPGAAWSAAGWPARFAAAARMATMVYPGPVGELLERELRAGLVCAGRFGAEPFVDEDALLIRVVEHVLGVVERRIAVARTTACSPPRSRWPGPVVGPPDPLEADLE